MTGASARGAPTSGRDLCRTRAGEPRRPKGRGHGSRDSIPGEHPDGSLGSRRGLPDRVVGVRPLARGLHRVAGNSACISGSQCPHRRRSGSRRPDHVPRCCSNHGRHEHRIQTGKEREMSQKSTFPPRAVDCQHGLARCLLLILGFVPCSFHEGVTA